MKTVDLFAGCGGLSLGFKNAGFDVVAAFDNWDYALEIYNANFMHNAYALDLTNVEHAINVIKDYSPQIIIGGPPCQDFSLAGNKNEGERAQLTIAFAEIVTGMKPEYFLMENVAAAIKSESYQNAKMIFKKAGYGLTEIILNACYCGVPQRRKRFFCIGHIDDNDGFLTSNLVSSQQLVPLTVREHFKSIGYSFEGTCYYNHPRTYGRRAIFQIDEPAPTIRGVNRPKPPEYKRHSADKEEPVNVRSLTTRERALVQTFPADFKFLGSPSAVEKVIGNAVPVKLAEYIATNILAYSKGDIHNKSGFIEWLQREKQFTQRAAGDVLSRINRAKKLLIIDNDNIQVDGLISIHNNKDFQALNKSVRSQLIRAVNLLNEYEKMKME